MLLIAAGLLGPHDPAENLLPLAIWTMWWVVIVLLHPLFGNLWAGLNPFTGLHALAVKASGTRLARPPLAYPAWLAYWPAFLIYFAFAWFQLVDPAPEDPTRLALVVIGYLAATLAAVMVFGPERWLGRADPFAVFLCPAWRGSTYRSGRAAASWPRALVAEAASPQRHALRAAHIEFHFL